MQFQMIHLGDFKAILLDTCFFFTLLLGIGLKTNVDNSLM